jgi:hypothetical protein
LSFSYPLLSEPKPPKAPDLSIAQRRSLLAGVCALRSDADPSLYEATVKRFGLVETSSLRGHESVPLYPGPPRPYIKRRWKIPQFLCVELMTIEIPLVFKFRPMVVDFIFLLSPSFYPLGDPVMRPSREHSEHRSVQMRPRMTKIIVGKWNI